MVTHNLKINAEFADAVFVGDKTFEIRRNDRNYRKGDRISFQVIRDGERIRHPLNETQWLITYILGDPYIAEDHVALAIKRIRTKGRTA